MTGVRSGGAGEEGTSPARANDDEGPMQCEVIPEQPRMAKSILKVDLKALGKIEQDGKDGDQDEADRVTTEPTPIETLPDASSNVENSTEGKLYNSI